jgi:hypothetical protein
MSTCRTGTSPCHTVEPSCEREQTGFGGRGFTGRETLQDPEPGAPGPPTAALGNDGMFDSDNEEASVTMARSQDSALAT